LKKAKIHFTKKRQWLDTPWSHRLLSGNMERALKHWTIAASAGDYTAMNNLTIKFEQGADSRETITSTLAAYNRSCVEMRK
jgi:hypothetical protein